MKRIEYFLDKYDGNKAFKYPQHEILRDLMEVLCIVSMDIERIKEELQCRKDDGK